jgi:hypothetical protein
VILQSCRASALACLMTGICFSPLLTRAQGDLSANALLRDVVARELKAQGQDRSQWMYRRRVILPGKQGQSQRTEDREVIQSTGGELDELLSVNGQPLTPEQRTQEDTRIQRLAGNASELRKLQKDQKRDAENTEQMFRTLPDAVIASYASRQDGLIELKFIPNPAFRASSREAQVFHAMEGGIWIDSKQNRLAGIEGHLTKEVKFGGGLLGHLDPGGDFRIKQTEMAPGHWEITVMHVNMRGKVLFFKTIGVQQDETQSDFQRVPDDLTPIQAAARLHAQTHITGPQQRPPNK